MWLARDQSRQQYHPYIALFSDLRPAIPTCHTASINSRNMGAFSFSGAERTWVCLRLKGWPPSSHSRWMSSRKLGRRWVGVWVGGWMGEHNVLCRSCACVLTYPWTVLQWESRRICASEVTCNVASLLPAPCTTTLLAMERRGKQCGQREGEGRGKRKEMEGKEERKQGK